LAAAGALTTTMLGLFLSIVLKAGAGAKNIIVLSVTMIGSLFAGMFGGDKNYFDNLAPLINKISPVGLITDGYYSLYYYDDLKRFWVNLGTLLAISAVLYVLSIHGLRRQRYDNI
jgi:ABC-2 type transport system permease protein